MRTLVVTAADENFFPLLQGLLRSLHQWDNRPLADIGVLDLGLSREQRAWVKLAARHIVEPGWDFSVNEAVRAQKPYARAYTARPFLPRYFPSYDLYVWLDADTWVQDRSALELLIAAGKDGALAIVPENHPVYVHSSETVKWRRDSVRRYFGYPAVRRGRWDTYVNSGVFALRGDAPHWGAWAKLLGMGIEIVNSKHFSDQTALNHAVWSENLPVTYLPERYNWLCHLATPRFDHTRQLFCVPDEEGHPIGIMHLTYTTKNTALTISTFRPNGLRYRGPRLPNETTLKSSNRGIGF